MFDTSKRLIKGGNLNCNGIFQKTELLRCIVLHTHTSSSRTKTSQRVRVFWRASLFRRLHCLNGRFNPNRKLRKMERKRLKWQIVWLRKHMRGQTVKQTSTAKRYLRLLLKITRVTPELSRAAAFRGVPLEAVVMPSVRGLSPMSNQTLRLQLVMTSRVVVRYASCVGTALPD